MNFPGFNTVNVQAAIPNLKWNDLSKGGSFLSVMFNIALILAAFFAFYWIVWGAFQYIMAQGKKEDLAKARARITWAIVGLIVVFLAYSIARLAAEVFPPAAGQLPF